jgi:hypothetical protein
MPEFLPIFLNLKFISLLTIINPIKLIFHFNLRLKLSKFNLKNYLPRIKLFYFLKPQFIVTNSLFLHLYHSILSLNPLFHSPYFIYTFKKYRLIILTHLFSDLTTFYNSLTLYPFQKIHFTIYKKFFFFL